MLIFFGAWLGLVLLAMPVAFGLGVVAVGWLLLEGAPMIGAPQRLMAGVDSFTLLAVPFFILAGNLMNTSGVTDRIYDFANSLVGHLRGGLGHVNIVGAVIFSGMSGSAVADAGGLGALEIKAMTKEGYPREFAGALTAASCVVGPIIPPSIRLVLYAVIANVSVGRLFLGGILPGIVIALCLMVYVWWTAGRRGFPCGRRFTWAERGRALARAFLPLLTPAIILGGMFAGIFTATEAAAVAALYALLLGTVVYRELGWRDLMRDACLPGEHEHHGRGRLHRRRRHALQLGARAGEGAAAAGRAPARGDGRSAAATSLIEAYRPSSTRHRYRNARATALRRVMSGRRSSTSTQGVTIAFRPPCSFTESGMTTVRVSAA